jgi:hypothetical protein
MLNVHSNTGIQKTGKRIRLSKNEIERQRQRLLEQAKEKAALGQKAAPTEPKYARSFWRDGVYHDSYGWAWGLDAHLRNICLGRTEEVVQRGKSRPGQKVSHSCHSKLRNAATNIPNGAGKSIVATLKKDPCFSRLLSRLIESGMGIRAIRTELKTKGYDIPLRTLGRWIQRQKTLGGQE